MIFDWSAVLWLVKRSLGGRIFIVLSYAGMPLLRKKLKWTMLYIPMPIYPSAKSYTHNSLCDGKGLRHTQFKLLEMIQMSLKCVLRLYRLNNKILKLKCLESRPSCFLLAFRGRVVPWQASLVWIAKRLGKESECDAVCL